MRALLAWAALIAACATPANAVAQPHPLGAARSELMALEDQRRFDGTVLGRHLADPDPDARRRAALAIGRIRDPRGIAPLLPVLADPDSSVAATAAFALGQIGDTAAVAALVPLLTVEVMRRTPTVAAEAATALGKLRSAAARRALETFLRSSPRAGSGTREAGGAALLAVWRFPRPADAAPILPWLESPDTAVRWRAAYALARRPDPAGTAALAGHADDASPLVRSFVVRALTAPLADSAGLGAGRALALLLAATRDPDPSVRVNAVRSLGTYDDPAALAELVRLLGVEDGHLAVTAAESLARQGDRAAGAAAELAAVAADPTRPVAVRAVALAAFTEVSPAAAAPLVARLQGAPEWRLRAAAGAAAAQQGSREAVAAALRDADARVAGLALSAAVGAAGDTVAVLRPLLTEALGHPDPIVRAGALGGFARMADLSDVPLLLDAYQRAGADTLLNDAALAAVAALGAVAAKHGGTPARAFFTRFPRPTDHLVRLAAAAAFGDSPARAGWGAPGPIEGALTAAQASTISAQPRQARLVTSRGVVSLELFAGDAPLTVRNFAALARRGYFDGQEWPRVVPNFVIQGGDPRGDTSGGPGYAIRDEINRRPYLTGTLGMALSGPDTGGSQWFITHSPQPHLDGTYTVFGRVVEGMDVVNRILPGDRIEQIEIIQ